MNEGQASSSRPQSAKARQSSPTLSSRPQSAKNNMKSNSSRPVSAEFLQSEKNTVGNELKSALKSSRPQSGELLSNTSTKEGRPQSAKNVSIDETQREDEEEIVIESEQPSRPQSAHTGSNDEKTIVDKPLTILEPDQNIIAEKNPGTETSLSRPQSAQENSKMNDNESDQNKRTSRPSSPIRRPTSAQSTDRPASAKKDEITVIIRPFCGEWQMGEDWPITLSYMSTFVDLKLYIEDEKGISAHRMQIKLKGKLLTATREKWTLRRMGVYDGYVIHLEPTFPESWWWNDYSYYVELLLAQIEKAIDDNGGGIFFSDLLPLVQIPMPIKVSLKVFIRSYPERLHVHCNTVEGTYWIETAKTAIELPTFSTYPHNLGKFPYAVLPPFDWDSYKDIDDKYKIEQIELGHDKLLDKGKNQKKQKGKASSTDSALEGLEPSEHQGAEDDEDDEDGKRDEEGDEDEENDQAGDENKIENENEDKIEGAISNALESDNKNIESSEKVEKAESSVRAPSADQNQESIKVEINEKTEAESKV
jgi:hypothetical protein